MAKLNLQEVDIVQVISQVLEAIRKNMLLIASFTVIGFAIGVGMAYFTKTTYEGSALIEPSLLSEKESEFLAKEIEKARTIPGLAPEVKEQVAGIKCEALKNEYGGWYLQLTAKVYDEKAFPSIQRAFIHYIDSVPSLIRHRENRARYFKEVIADLEKEMAAMEEVKKEVDGKLAATYLNPANIYATSNAFFKERMEYVLRQEEIKKVQVVKSFDKLTLKIQSNKPKAGFLGGVVGLILAFPAIALRYFFSFFNKYKKQNA